MKINTLETHDRLLHFNKQWEAVAQGCQECIRNVPDEITSPFYVFAHSRTIDIDEKMSLIKSNIADVPSMRMIWTPRITKPQAQSNSYLFMVNKKSDIVKILWLIPASELWYMFAPDKMTHHPDVWTSINNYQYCRSELNKPDPDGPTAQDVERWRKVYANYAISKKTAK